MNKNTKILLAVALCVVLITLFFVNKRRSHKVVQKAAPINIETSGVVERKPDKRDLVSSKATAEAFQTAIKKDQQQVAAGFLSVPVKSRNLRINIDVRTACHWGEIDILKREFVLLNKRSLILSLEPLPGFESKFDPIKKVLSYKDVTDGGGVDLETPELSQPVAAGLYICSTDAAATDRCSNKDAGDIGNALKSMQQRQKFSNNLGGPKGVKAPKLGPPRVYYFQTVLAGPAGLQIQNNTRPSADTAAHAKTYLASTLGEDAGRETLKLSAGINKSITSVPIAIDNAGVHLTLYKQDPNNCGALTQARYKPEAAALPPLTGAIHDMSKVKIPPPPDEQ